jgi:hypothetical protein
LFPEVLWHPLFFFRSVRAAVPAPVFVLGEKGGETGCGADSLNK